MSTALDPFEPGLVVITIITASGNTEVETFGGLINAVMNVTGWGWTEMGIAFKLNPLTVKKWAKNETDKPQGFKKHFAAAKLILRDHGAKLESYYKKTEEPTAEKSSADDD